MAEIDLQQQMIDRDKAAWEANLRQSATQRGVSYDPSDLEGVIRQVSYASNAGKDPGDFIKQQQSIYDQRAKPTLSAGGSGGDWDRNSDGQRDTPAPQSAPAPAPMSAPSPSLQFPTTAQNFSDPVSSQLEQFALAMMQRMQNPPPDSGQASLESALKALAGQFEQGGYTPAETEILQTQAIDPLERLRTTRKQQVLHTLSQRGIDPKSGVGMQMLADVDRQFDQQRTVTQRDVAGKAAEERRARMLQSVELLSGLAGTQNQRYSQAFDYAKVPYNMSQQAFSNALQTYNAAGNPLTLAQPYMSLANMQNGQNNSLQETLGYLAGILLGGKK